jgi:hypothetical protein
MIIIYIIHVLTIYLSCRWPALILDPRNIPDTESECVETTRKNQWLACFFYTALLGEKVLYSFIEGDCITDLLPEMPNQFVHVRFHNRESAEENVGSALTNAFEAATFAQDLMNRGSYNIKGSFEGFMVEHSYLKDLVQQMI